MCEPRALPWGRSFLIRAFYRPLTGCANSFSVPMSTIASGEQRNGGLPREQLAERLDEGHQFRPLVHGFQGQRLLLPRYLDGGKELSCFLDPRLPDTLGVGNHGPQARLDHPGPPGEKLLVLAAGERERPAEVLAGDGPPEHPRKANLLQRGDRDGRLLAL